MTHPASRTPHSLELRPETGSDREFLYRLYASNRESELENVGWDPVQKCAFLTMQFDTRHRSYVDQYPGASRHVIEADGRPVGRLWIDDQPNEIRVVDIALLPEVQNQGIGSRVLNDVIERADVHGKTIRLHVDRASPARRLYERLGFVAWSESGLYAEMARTHDQENTASYRIAPF